MAGDNCDRCGAPNAVEDSTVYVDYDYLCEQCRRPAPSSRLSPEREASLRDGNYVHADVLALLDALATARAEGRAEALHEAALLCDAEEKRRYLSGTAGYTTCEHLASRIRALAASEATR